MKQIRLLVNEHRHHVVGALALAAAIFLALCGVHHLGIGGIRINPWLLAAGLLAAESGRSLSCFGVKLKSLRYEYGGVLIQGLAWWIWSLNFSFLSEKHGWDFLFHLLCPAILLGTLPAVAHYARKQLIDEPAREQPASGDEDSATTTGAETQSRC